MRTSSKKLGCTCLLTVFTVLLLSHPAFAQGGNVRVFQYSNLGTGGSEEVHMSLSDLGFTSDILVDLPASRLRTQLATLDSFVYIGHGMPGVLICTADEKLSAKSVPNEPNNYSLEAYYGTSTEKLQNIKLAYFGCCHSDEESALYGRLTTYVTETLGATTSIGFTGSVYDEESTFYETRFFYYLSQGKEVQCASDCALGDLQALYYETYYLCNVSSVKVYGQQNLVLGTPQGEQE